MLRNFTDRVLAKLIGTKVFLVNLKIISVVPLIPNLFVCSSVLREAIGEESRAPTVFPKILFPAE
jgi:hypothetical protein